MVSGQGLVQPQVCSASDDQRCRRSGSGFGAGSLGTSLALGWSAAGQESSFCLQPNFRFLILE